MRRIGGIVLTVTGILFCPCHLILTLPLLISLLAGTAQVSVLLQNTDLVYIWAGIYFVVALALGALLLFSQQRQSDQEHDACPTCIPADANTPEQRR